MQLLNSYEMQEALDRFVQAVDRCSKAYSGDEIKSKMIKEWSINIINTNIATMFTPDGLDNITNSIYTNATIRDYMYSLSFTFYTTSVVTTNPDDKFNITLANTLCNALQFTGERVYYPSPELIQLEQQLPINAIKYLESSRENSNLSSDDKYNVSKFLDSNRLLVIYLLLYLTVEIV